VVLVAGVTALQPAWAQCGGIGFTGDTACVSGHECAVMNPYFSQCLPAAASSSTPTPTPTTTTKTASVITSTTVIYDPFPTNLHYWFSFGDSYSQTWFNISGTKPSVGNPMGNPDYPGWTACAGGNVPNWVGLITTKYNASTILTYNLAYGGATIDANLVKPYVDTVQSLTDQVNLFLANKAVAPWKAYNTLFSVWIGINDIGNSFWLSNWDAFSDTLFDAYFALVQKLYDAGGRNFLFLNVPHVNRSPLMLTQPDSSRDLEKWAIDLYNTKLAARVASFKSSHTGVTTWLYQSDIGLDTILDNPTTYGF
ncbi:hypothetical protein BDV93DRAFT_415003, partial [Ceratobasidium sp. AG-I]